jgi:D-psicose/D-tagatose/L-ribulose 3-epimerase
VNPLGIHALVWTEGWSEDECRRAVALTKKCGYDLIEIPLLDPTAVDAVMTRRVLGEAGLDASCSLGLDFDTDVSSADPAVAARGEELLERAIDVTSGIGATFLGGVVHSAMGKYLAPPTEQGRRNCVEALRRLAERAERVGVTIGVEAVNRYESNLVNTAEQALALVEEIGAPNVVVHLDSYHMNIEEANLADPVRACRERLGYVHVGESHRGSLGSGTVPFHELFGALAEIDYDGPITFESFSTAVISERFATALAVWRDHWQDGRDLAAHARRFLLDQLTAATKAFARRPISP